MKSMRRLLRTPHYICTPTYNRTHTHTHTYEEGARGEASQHADNRAQSGQLTLVARGAGGAEACAGGGAFRHADNREQSGQLTLSSREARAGGGDAALGAAVPRFLSNLWQPPKCSLLHLYCTADLDIRVYIQSVVQ